MRLVVSSDWHGDWVTDGFERHDDLKDGLQSVAQALDERPSVSLFLGDLSNPYSRNVHRAVSTAVSMAANMTARRIPNYWLVGNHDIVEDRHGSHSLMALAPLSLLEYTRVIDLPGLEVIDSGVEVRHAIMLPFTSPKNAYDPEEVVHDCAKQLKDVPSEQVIVMGHLNIEGISVGSETSEMSRGRDVFWPEAAIKQCFPKALWLNGHYHTQQVFRGIHIPGSLFRLTHGEETNSPSFLVFEGI